jgi:hypothetical protein
MEDAVLWLKELRQFALDQRANVTVPDGHGLEPRQNWKRRVSGGVLLQFLDFVQSGNAEEHFGPALEERPLHDRIFLFITDLAGAVAGQELLQQETDHVFCILKSEWSAWLSEADTDHDEDFDQHYEFWSVWHQDIHSQWDVDELEGVEYWVHEEGFALADKAGRGAQHLWKWDGEEMQKLEEAVTSWSSIPTEPTDE